MATAAHRLNPVVLEFTRGGSSADQVLSMITPYIALCGNEPAEIVHLPFGQLDFDSRREALAYRVKESQRRQRLAEMGRSMRGILDSVPGLSPALASTDWSTHHMVHLRLVVTPNELAQLPFECTEVPKGAPGGVGEKLLLQPASPVTMTREVRGVTSKESRWPAAPNVLFAWAAPHGVGKVPYEEHLLAIRKALTPWIFPYRGTTPMEQAKDDRLEQVNKYLTVIPDASIDKIYQACSKTRFTHIHILAHGIPTDEKGLSQRVGLALHHRRSRLAKDIVDGSRLANALRFRDPEHESAYMLPNMVTIASCDSSEVRPLVTHGASVAHALHLAGIPVVVASQFPLSIPGSVVMAEELYRRAFGGEDARVAMFYVRRRLFTLLSDSHDWASLVVYSSLPADFERQVADNQFTVAKQHVDRTINEANGLIERAPTNEEAWQKLKRVSELLVGLDKPIRELPKRGADAAEAIGLQASAEKQRAEVLFWVAHLRKDEDEFEADDYKLESLAALEKAMQYYREAMNRELSNYWVVVQYLSLSLLLERVQQIQDAFSSERWTRKELCTLAKVAAELDLKKSKPSARAWAHANLSELALLAATQDVAHDERERLEQEVCDHIHGMLDVVPKDSFEVFSTRRQFVRYGAWWSQPLNPRFPKCSLNTADIARKALELFPPREIFKRY